MLICQVERKKVVKDTKVRSNFSLIKQGCGYANYHCK